MKDVSIGSGKYDHIWPEVLYDGVNLIPPPSRVLASCAVNQALMKNGAFNSDEEIESLISQGWTNLQNEEERFILFSRGKYKLIITIRSFDDTSESFTIILIER
jgi:hypothetical protein